MLAENAIAATFPALLVVRIVKAAALIMAGQVAATGIISARVIALMEGGLKAMWMTKLKIASATWVALGFTGIGAGVLAKGMLAARAPDAPSAASGETARIDADKQKAPVEPPAAGKQQQPSSPLQLARNQAESRLNLKQLASAMHNYQATYNHLPAPAIYSGQGDGSGVYGPYNRSAYGPYGRRDPLAMPPPGPMGGPRLMGPGQRVGRGPAPRGPMTEATPYIVSKDGKALLSWRVAILPFLGQGPDSKLYAELNKLYAEFKLDEPWDSAHNKKLLSRMPEVYAPPGMTTRQPYSTFYQVFVGPHAAFQQHRAMSLGSDFPDGMSNVLLIVEAGCAVPWTKPEDLHFAVDEPIPELGGLFPGIFHAAFADGSVWPLSKKVDSDTLRKLVMRDDGEPIDLDRIKVPVSRREAELKQQNDRLKQEVERQRARLQALRREQEALEEMAEGPGTELLKQDNARLEELLRQAHEEADRLNQEIQRLKQALEKRLGEKETK
jgi:hypothetical protein